MILNYGVRNFTNFKEGVHISFELSTNCPKKFSNGNQCTNILCVNGPNASGKTNLLKALGFLNFFCCNSFGLKPEDSIPFESHFFSKENTEFYIEFIEFGVKYRYELSLNEKEVVSEKIYRIRKRSTLLFERKKDLILNEIKEFEELKTIKKLRLNASIISIANQYEINCMEPIYSFFNGLFTNVTYYGLVTKLHKDSNVSKIYKEEKDIFDFIKEIICKFDLGITNIKIISQENPEKEEEKEYYPVFYHDRCDKKISKLLLSHQSSGTQSLYLTLINYWIALQYGGVLIMDEFDINLHPHILPSLLELFTNSKKNKYNAQLIFTTHNIEILDLMGKYRTFVLNKHQNESFGYRLDEIQGDLLRNDRSIVPVLKSGKIGGIPRI